MEPHHTMSPRVGMVRLVVFAALLCPGAAHAQWADFYLYEENDTFAPQGLTSDEYYTQGLRFVVMRDGQHTWGYSRAIETFMRTKLKLVPPGYSARSGLVIGHVIQTPTLITSYDVDPDDRPYAGYLYAGLRAEIVPLEEGPREWGFAMRHSFEGQVGFLGPPGLGKAVQKAFHVLRAHRIPKGWDQEIGTEPTLGFLYAWNGRWGTHFFDVNPVLGFSLGTVQTYPTAGLTVRAGWNMTGFPVAPAPITVEPAEVPVGAAPAERASWELALFGGIDVRYFVRNAYLDGSLVGGEPSIDSNRYVYDLRAGASVRLFHDWRLTYTLVRRSRELDESLPASKPSHYFGSLALSREWKPQAMAAGHGEATPFLLRDWSGVFGLGVGTSRLLPDDPADRTLNGPSGELGIEKGLTRTLTLGVAVAAIGREYGPPDSAGAHRDGFLTVQALTVGYRLLRSGPAELTLRVGAGRGVLKNETTVNGIPTLEESYDGFAYLAGARYTHRLGGSLALGLSTTYGALSADAHETDDSRFLAASLVVQLR